MTDRQDLWGLMTGAQSAIVQNFGSKIQEAVQDSIFNGVQGWGLLGFATNIKPEPLTVDFLTRRNPYGNTDHMDSNITALKDVNMLDDNGVITEKADEAYQKLVDTQNQAISELDAGEADVAKASEYIVNIFEAALALDEPDNTNLKDASTRDINDTPLHTLFYYTARLNAFRDDAHIAAWRKNGIENGRTLEALSILWADSEEANTAEAMAEGRPYRGWEVSDWQTSLDDIVERGWAEKDGDGYTITEDGKRIRDTIETQTDEYFYAAFAGLSDDDVDDFANTLTAIQTHFTPERQAQ